MGEQTTPASIAGQGSLFHGFATLMRGKFFDLPLVP